MCEHARVFTSCFARHFKLILPIPGLLFMRDIKLMFFSISPLPHLNRFNSLYSGSREHQYCEDKFSVEPLDVVYEDGREEPQVTPRMSTRTATASVMEICSIIGVEVSSKHRTSRKYPR